MSVTFSALGCRLQATWITEEIVKYKSGNPQNAIIPDFKRSIKTILLQFHYRNCWDDSIFTKTILPNRNPGLFQYGLPGFILHTKKKIGKQNFYDMVHFGTKLLSPENLLTKYEIFIWHFSCLQCDSVLYIVVVALHSINTCGCFEHYNVERKSIEKSRRKTSAHAGGKSEDCK